MVSKLVCEVSSEAFNHFVRVVSCAEFRQRFGNLLVSNVSDLCAVFRNHARGLSNSSVDRVTAHSILDQACRTQGSFPTRLEIGLYDYGQVVDGIQIYIAQLAH